MEHKNIVLQKMCMHACMHVCVSMVCAHTWLHACVHASLVTSKTGIFNTFPITIKPMLNKVKYSVVYLFILFTKQKLAIIYRCFHWYQGWKNLLFLKMWVNGKQHEIWSFFIIKIYLFVLRGNLMKKYGIWNGRTS